MIATVLSAISAFSLAALSCYSLFSRKTSAHRPLALTAAVLCGIVILDQTMLSAGENFTEFRRAGLFLEAVLPAAVLWYGFSFARREPVRPASVKGAALAVLGSAVPAIVLLLPPADFFYSPDFQTEHILFLADMGYWFYLGILIACVVALVNLEATFRSCSRSDRWKIKFEAVGMGSILAVLIFYFSQALLYRTIDATTVPARSVVLSAGTGLVLVSAVLRGNGVRVSVSRFLFYRSAALAAVGVYCIVLALLGEGMKYLDAPLGRNLTVLTAFITSIVLVTALLSEKLRHRVKVILSKHFFADKHDYRQTWLDLTGRLAQCGSLAELEREIPSAFREIFGLRSASLYLLRHGSGTYVPVRREGAASAGFKPSPVLLSYWCDRNRVWNVSDGEYAASEDEKHFVREEKAWLVVPLICSRQVEGLVVFGAPFAPAPFTYEDYDLMKIIARQCGLLLNNLRLSKELIEAREFAAVARVSSFVVHDLKNLTHVLSLMMDNAEEHIGNPEFQQDMIVTIRHTLGNMKKLTQKLKAVPDGAIRKNTEPVNILLLSRAVAADFQKTRPGAALLCKGSDVSCIADSDELRKVIINLVQNGLEAVGQEGAVTIETGSDGGRAFVRVSDTGCGMTADFMERGLFRPFQTTKKTGLGIGLYHCKQIVEAAEGAIEVTSAVGKGSSFTVYLPAMRPSMQLVA